MILIFFLVVLPFFNQKRQAADCEEWRHAPDNPTNRKQVATKLLTHKPEIDSSPLALELSQRLTSKRTYMKSGAYFVAQLIMLSL